MRGGSPTALGPGPGASVGGGLRPSSGFGFSHGGLSLKVPKGFFCHHITGSKKTINSQSAFYGPSPTLYGAWTGKVCGWRIDFTYHSDKDGSQYRTDMGPTNHGCSYVVKRSTGATRSPRWSASSLSAAAHRRSSAATTAPS
jgi:hypothetical protein